MPHKTSNLKSPSVVKLSSKNNPAEWHKKIFDFIKTLKASGKIDDFNQIAFLFSSVKNDKVVAFANFLEKSGINVYSPRSDMFFQREEIKIALGCAFKFLQKKTPRRSYFFLLKIFAFGCHIFAFIRKCVCKV